MPKVTTIDGFDCLLCGSPDENRLCIYYLGLPQGAADVQKLLKGFPCPVVYIVIKDWDNQLTPWPAKGLYHGDSDFKGEAAETLKSLAKKVIPGLDSWLGFIPEKRCISGYSLAGLFSVYAFANSDEFDAVASMSGSFWYEGWTNYIESMKLDKNGCVAFFSLGDKERKAKEKILHSVQANTEVTVHALESWGVEVEHHLVRGGHFDNISERVLEGLSYIVNEDR